MRAVSREPGQLSSCAALRRLRWVAGAWIGFEDWQSTMWGCCGGFVLAGPFRDIVSSLRRGEFGLDLVAALSMTVALYFGETLAAAVVALMYAGGEMLEQFAETRALSEMKALLGRVPKMALRYRDGHLEECRSAVSCPATACWCGRARSFRSTAWSRRDGTARPGDPDRRIGAGAPPHGEEVMSGSSSLDMAFDMAAAAAPPTAPIRASCGWSRQPRRPRRRWCGWPTAMPCGSCH